MPPLEITCMWPSCSRRYGAKAKAAPAIAAPAGRSAELAGEQVGADEGERVGEEEEEVVADDRGLDSRCRRC